MSPPVLRSRAAQRSRDRRAADARVAAGLAQILRRFVIDGDLTPLSDPDAAPLPLTPSGVRRAGLRCGIDLAYEESRTVQRELVTLSLAIADRRAHRAPDDDDWRFAAACAVQVEAGSKWAERAASAASRGGAA